MSHPIHIHWAWFEVLLGNHKLVERVPSTKAVCSNAQFPFCPFFFTFLARPELYSPFVVFHKEPDVLISFSSKCKVIQANGAKAKSCAFVSKGPHIIKTLDKLHLLFRKAEAITDALEVYWSK